MTLSTAMTTVSIACSQRGASAVDPSGASAARAGEMGADVAMLKASCVRAPSIAKPRLAR